jgi:hypothetical protein
MRFRVMPAQETNGADLARMSDMKAGPLRWNA